MTYKAPSKPLPKGNVRISLFHLTQRTPEGNRVICQDLTFSQASALATEIPTAVLKFSRMEVMQ